MKVLSIDAWAEPEGGWNWNQWYHVGDISKAADSLFLRFQQSIGD